MSHVPTYYVPRSRRGLFAFVAVLIVALSLVVLAMLFNDRGPVYSSTLSAVRQQSVVAYIRQHPHALPNGWREGVVIRTGTGDDHSGLYAVVLVANGTTVDVVAYGQKAQAALALGNYVAFDVNFTDDLLIGVGGKSTVAVITTHAVRL